MTGAFDCVKLLAPSAALDAAGGAARSARFFDRLEAGMAARLAAAPARTPLAKMALVKQ